MKSIYNEIRMR